VALPPASFFCEPADAAAETRRDAPWWRKVHPDSEIVGPLLAGVAPCELSDGPSRSCGLSRRTHRVGPQWWR
jgi:hypothetical protein